MLIKPNEYKFLRVDIFNDSNELVITQEGYNEIKLIPLHSNGVTIENIISFKGTPKYTKNQRLNNTRILTHYDLNLVDFTYITDDMLNVKIGNTGRSPKIIPYQFLPILRKYRDRVVTIDKNLNGEYITINDENFQLIYNDVYDKSIDITVQDDIVDIDLSLLEIDKYDRGVIVIGNNVKSISNIPSNFEFSERGTYVTICVHDKGDTLMFITKHKTHSNTNILEFKRKGV